MPAFQTRRLPAYAARIVDITQEFCTTLPHQAAQGDLRIDMDDLMAKLTLDIALDTLLGAEGIARRGDIGTAVQVLSEVAFRESTSAMTLPDWLPTRAKRDKRWAIKTLDNLVMNVVRTRIRTAGDDHDDNLLSSLITHHQGQINDIRDDTMSLLIAGHETSGALLCWVFGCLACHPEWADRARAEIAAHLGQRPASSDDLPKLKVINAIVQETLRLYPAAYTLFLRQAVEDLNLSGHEIKKGDLVQIIPYTMQRDPRFFADPTRFDPSRFLTTETWPKYAYLPFGAGPRVCIGQSFGIMESILVITTLLQYGLPAPLPDLPPPHPRFSLRPKGGLKMVWHPEPIGR